MKPAIKYLALLAVFMGAFWSVPTDMRAQIGNRAALVISFGDDKIETACVDFEEPQISGFDLLQRSGLNLEIEAQGLGALVCSINDAGCSASDCLCQCSGGGDCIYWSYWHQLEEGWQYSQAGATVYQVESGAVEGWSWGPGAESQALPPPEISFEDICQQPASNTPTPSLSSVAINLAVDSITPTVTAKPVSQLTAIESGGVPPIGDVDKRPQFLDQYIQSDALLELIPYVIFLMIMGGLGIILFVFSWRRKSKGMQ